MMYLTDQVFAPVHCDDQLERIGGGSETDVYRTADQRYVVKLKSDRAATLQSTLALARVMRAAAEQFAAYLGGQHSIPSHFVVARNSAGQIQALIVQPFLHNADALANIDYAVLGASERALVVTQLRHLIRRALACYRATGHIPDLHGSVSASSAERTRINALSMWPWRIWSFFTESLLRSHNLLLIGSPEYRVVLVDYDRVRWRHIGGSIFYLIRSMLFWRDHMLLRRMISHSTEAHAM